MSEILYGRQPVYEMLKAGRRQVEKAYLLKSAKSSEDMNAIHAGLSKTGAGITEVDRKELDKITADSNHQGVAVRVSGYPYMAESKLMERAGDTAHPPLLLVLDHIEDPQNLGSLLRTADAAGVDAVIIPKDRASGVTPAAVRASAGAAEHVAVCMVTNLVQTMKNLKDRGLWFTGLEGVPEATPYTESDFSGAVGLVVGSEGKGLGRLVRENCDFLVKLPRLGKVSSLNAAIAGAITLFEIRRRRDVVAEL